MRDEEADAFGATLAGGPSTIPAPRLDVSEAPLEEGDDERYELREVLGEGGMGEVRLCRDRRLGREVALKVIRATGAQRPDLRARFEREARVQGQLEHPSIVPIYDIGLDAHGAAYFTMRRVRGLTLEQVLEARRKGSAAAQSFSPARLLGAFASVCQAVAFAHARGLVHRDLKPANIMLGDFGEVYLLDWGLAKVVGAPETAGGAEGASVHGSGATRAGDAMGTPGYMAPGQVRGELDRVDERCDVYALGAILFELLTLERLHQGATVQELYATTLGGAEARAAVRAPGHAVPPELEAVYVRATALEPAERFPSARELHDAVERYVEGDRDLERRRVLARGHAAEALRHAEAAAGSGGGASHQAALREAGAALALDPEQHEALGLLARLLLAAPREVPASARLELDEASDRVQHAAARTGVSLYLGWLLFVPVLLLLGVRSWPLFATGVALLATTLALAALSLRPALRRLAGFSAFVGGSALVGIGSTVLGPHMLVPNLALTNVLAFTLFGDRALRVPAIAIGTLSFVVPWALQATGVVAASYRFEGGGFSVVPMMTSLPEWGVHLLMLLANVALIAPIAAYVGRIRDQVGQSEQSLFLQAWSLRQLLPAEVARKAAAATPLTLG